MEKAMEAELLALNENQTWSIVDLPKGKVPVDCKWVYKVKYNGNGSIERYKLSPSSCQRIHSNGGH
jgi:hypothetical protein